MNLNFNFEGYDVSIYDNPINGLYKFEVSFAGVIRGEFKTVRVHLTDYVYDTESSDRAVAHTTDMTLWLAHKLGEDHPNSFLQKLIPFMKEIMAKAEAEYESENELNRIFLELESMEIVPAFDVPSYNFKYGYDEFTWNGYYTASELPVDWEYDCTCPVFPKVGYFEYPEVDDDSVSSVKSESKPNVDSQSLRESLYYDLDCKSFVVKGACVSIPTPKLVKVFETRHKLVKVCDDEYKANYKSVAYEKFIGYDLPESFYKTYGVGSWLKNWDCSPFSPLF